MPKPAQTREEFEAVRARLIETARQINSAEGPAAVTLRRVARQAGYSPASMYRYFADAEELTRAAWADTVARLGAHIQTTLADIAEPLARIAALMRAYGEFAEQNLTAFRATFLLLIRRPGATRIFDDYLTESPFAILMREIAGAMEAGAIPAGDVNLTAQTVWGVLHGVMGLNQTVSDFPFIDAPTRLDHAIRLTMAGLRAAR